MDERPEELAVLVDPADRVLVPLPIPGRGATAERFRALWGFAARSPSLGRVAEAHHDALAILAEAGRTTVHPGLHAVWAAGDAAALRIEKVDGRRVLRGTKSWCSASTFAIGALVTAQMEGHGGALVLVDLRRDGVRPAAPSWQSPAIREVDTRTVHFDLVVDPDDVVGVDDWYLRRPGFWHGAVGVAACWAGCIDGIVDRLVPTWRADAHAIAHLGAIDAARWNLRTIIEAAAGEIDAAPAATDGAGERRALRVRHLVDAAVDDIIARLSRALGPAPLAHTADLHRHLAETDLFRRQAHAERDLETLGRLARPIAPQE